MRKPWTKKELKLLKKMYRDAPTKKIARILKRSVLSIYQAADLQGVKKSEEFKRSAASGRLRKGNHGGKKFWFKKGHKPWNAGTKGVCKPNAGTFKKGNLPVNTLHNGAITTRIETTRSGKQTPYKWIRIAKSKWKMLHAFNWEKANGKVPKGHILIFKDGNTENCQVSNLRLISNADHMRETQLKDETIAVRLSMQKWSGGKRRGMNRELYKKVLNNKALLEVKRQQIILNQTIKNHDAKRKTKKDQ